VRVQDDGGCGPSQLALAAWHEAGHVIGYLACRREFRTVSITPLDDVVSGQVDVDPAPIRPEQHILIAHAGPVSEALLEARSIDLDEQGLDLVDLIVGAYLTGGDHDQATIETTLAARPALRAERLAIEVAAQELIESQWADVSAVAEALVNRGALDFSQVLDVLGRQEYGATQHVLHGVESIFSEKKLSRYVKDIRRARSSGVGADDEDEFELSDDDTRKAEIVEALIANRYIEGFFLRLQANFPSLVSADIEDAINNVATKLMKRPGLPDDVRAWAFRVAYRELVDVTRKRRREVLDPLDTAGGILVPGAPSAEDEAMPDVIYQALRKQAESWAVSNVKVITLLYLESLRDQTFATDAELAELASDLLDHPMSEGAAATSKSRGLKRLKSELGALFN
jgi:DNA-directed RNA polymerase specialized sigma24 family protein